MDEKAILLLCGVICLVVGLILLAIGTIPVVRTLLFLRTAIEAPGTIVDLRVETGGESTQYQAAYEFKTHEGETIRWRQFGWRSTFPGNVGDEVTMKYNPKNPKRARTANARDMWLFGASIGISGLIVTGFGLWLLILME